MALQGRTQTGSGCCGGAPPAWPFPRGAGRAGGGSEEQAGAGRVEPGRAVVAEEQLPVRAALPRHHGAGRRIPLDQLAVYVRRVPRRQLQPPLARPVTRPGSGRLERDRARRLPLAQLLPRGAALSFARRRGGITALTGQRCAHAACYADSVALRPLILPRAPAAALGAAAGKGRGTHLGVPQDRDDVRRF